ncbi:MAG: FHA domain-containing protein [Candidatus Zipacnadales bacterium]
MSLETVWLLGRYAFVGLLYFFVLLVLRALVIEMREEAVLVPARHTDVAFPVQSSDSDTGDLAPVVAGTTPPGSSGSSRDLPPRLVVVESADPRVLPVGTTLNLTAVTTIGRGTHNSLALSSDQYASTNHALLVMRDGVIYLRDRGSKNGTFLNGALVEAETALADGDRITVGTTVLRYSAGNLASRSAVQPFKAADSCDSNLSSQ